MLTIAALSFFMMSGLSNCGASTTAPEPEDIQIVTDAVDQTESESGLETTDSAADTTQTETDRLSGKPAAASRTDTQNTWTEPGEEPEHTAVRTNENGDVFLPEV